MPTHKCIRLVILGLLCCALGACGDDDDRDHAANGDHDAGRSATPTDGGLLSKDGGSPDAGPGDAAVPDASDSGAWQSDYAACLDYDDREFDVSPGPDARFSGPESLDTTPIGPLISLHWSPEQSGLYAISAFADYVAGDPSLAVAAGDCGGPMLDVDENTQEHLGSPEARPIVLGLQATAGNDYVIKVIGSVRRRDSHYVRVRVKVKLLCPGEAPDSCVAVHDSELVCGVQVHIPTPVDHVECYERTAPGEADPRCPDSEYGGERVEGCCRPDGVCGQLDPVLGCHLGAQVEWPYWPERLQFFCDERAQPDPPDFYVCAHEDEPCAADLDCCAHYNYGNASCIAGKCVLPDR